MTAALVRDGSRVSVASRLPHASVVAHDWALSVRTAASGIASQPYEGPYEVTPSGEAQVLSCERLRMEHDVVIHPVPGGWGRITWDGSTITVS